MAKMNYSTCCKNSVYPELSAWIDGNSLTQSEFGEMVDLDHHTIGCFLRGQKFLGISNLVKICDFTGLMFVINCNGGYFTNSVLGAIEEPPATEREFGELRNWIRERNLSLTKLAELSGITANTISRLFKSEHDKQVAPIQKICAVTGLIYVIAPKDRGFRRIVGEIVTLEPMVEEMPEESIVRVTETEEIEEEPETVYYIEEEPEEEEASADDISSIVADSITEAVAKILGEIQHKNAEPENMTLNEYQELAARTIDGVLSDDDVEYHALFGLAAEVGEIHSLYQKYFQGHDLIRADLIEEIGDALWMLSELCTVLDVKLSDVANYNIEKLKKRYPDGFDPKRSIHREV